MMYILLYAALREAFLTAGHLDYNNKPDPLKQLYSHKYIQNS